MATAESHPVDAMREIARGARNDEIIELAFFVFEELADRAEGAADLAIDSGDREALNEAFVLASRAHSVTPNYGFAKGRVEDPGRRIFQTQRLLEDAVQEARSATVGPKPARSRRERRIAEWEAQRAEETAALERVGDITAERVHAVLRDAGAVAGEPVAVSDVVGLLTAESPVPYGSTAWRRLVALVTAQLVKAARAGSVVQIRPADSRDGRVTCRWAVPDAG